MAKRLTPATLATKAPASGRIEVRDSDSPLVFRVTENKTRSLSVRTRLHREQIRLTYPRAVIAENLGDARQWALGIVAKCKAGTDPRLERKREIAEEAQRRVNTVGAVAEEFLKRHVAKLRSAKIAEGVIRRELLGQVQEGEEWVDDRRDSRWRDRPITEIARRDVVQLLERIVDSGRPYLARLVLAYARKLFRWAIERDAYGLETNPCYGVSAKEHGAPAVARQVTLGPDHLSIIWRAAGELGQPFGHYVKLLLLSGQRRNEIARLQWSEIDMGEGVIVLPAERMKAKRPHEVPLSPAMAELLGTITRDRGSYLFSTTRGASPVSGFAKLKAKLDKKAAELHATERKEAHKRGHKHHGPKELPAWRLHDLRRTMRTGLGAIPSIPHDIRELVVGHIPTALVRTYDLHGYREEKRQALTLWAERLTRIVEPSNATEGAAP